MKILLLLGVSAILIGVASDLYASAIVTSLQGPVLVNRGGGFMRLATNAQLADTDRVMANPGGEATLTYSDGCIKRVTPGTVVTVGNVRGCRIIEEGRSADLPVRPTPEAPEEPLGIDPAIVIGAVDAVIIGGAIAAAVSNHGGGGGGGGGRPISP